MPQVPVRRVAAPASDPRAAAGDAHPAGRPLRHAGPPRSSGGEGPVAGRYRRAPGAGRRSGSRRTVPFPVPDRAARTSTSRGRRAEAAAAKSAGCLACHQGTARPALASPRRSGSAASIATAATLRPATCKQAHVWPRFPDAWGSSGNPVRSYTLLNHESPGVHPVREPRRLAGRPPELRHDELPRRPGPAGAQEHDDPRRDALGRCAFQQRLGSVQAGPLRRELQHERRAAAAPDRPPADAASRWNARESCRSSTRCPGSRPRSPATSCGSSSAAGASRRRSASPTRSKSPGKPQRRVERPRPGDPEPHRPRLRRPPENPALRPDAQLPRAPTTIPATIAPAAAPPAT